MTVPKQLGDTIGRAVNGVKYRGTSIAVAVSVAAFLLSLSKPLLPTGEAQASLAIQMKVVETKLEAVDESTERLEAVTLKLQADVSAFSLTVGRLTGLLEAWSRGATP